MRMHNVGQLCIILLLLIVNALCMTTPLSYEEAESTTYSPDSLMMSEKYVRVSKKMAAYCDQPYSEADDKIIDMYTHCFSNLIRADKDIVSNCRMRILRSARQLKVADCSKEFTPQSLEIRKCITDQMTSGRNPDFQFRDGDDADDDTHTRLFLNCMDQIL